jgi:restriction endonuclease S subunit
VNRDSELPQGWRVLRFDQIAENIAERVEPADATQRHYVGLEHLDPESFHIRRWGTPDDVKGTKLCFRKGDVIFGRRRFYQRKVAVAAFDGICSAHAMVLRAREDTMLQSLLPFFLQSETFYQRAMQISVGSLSPTINWRTLARQEFAVPPPDEQRRIAEILWAADRSVVAAEQVAQKAEKLLIRACQEWTSDPSQFGPDNWRTVKIRDCVEVLDNLRVPLNRATRTNMQGDIPYYGATGPIDYINDFIFEQEIVLIGEDGDHFLKYDSWPQAHLVRGKSWVNNHAHVLRARTEYCANLWLYRFFQYRNILPFLQDSASMTRKKLTKVSLSSIPVCIPTRDAQEHILRALGQVDDSHQKARCHLEKAIALGKSLRTEYIG